MLNPKEIKKKFPILNQKIHEKPLIYLDSAASSQKPQQVIRKMSSFLRTDYANVHRGVHYLSQQATDKCEQVREKIQKFINAQSSSEIIFTKGTTESINTVAFSYCQSLKPGSEIIITEMEHHSNIVPWQIACQKYNLTLKHIPVLTNGELDLKAYTKILTKNTALVAITHASNVLGTINPLKQIITQAHLIGAKVLVDGAQAVPHFKVNVQELDCDFYCFSSHKLYGPSGIGILYAKKNILDTLPPFQFGGGMIETVTLDKTTFAEPPLRFEAGTPPIEAIIGFGAAIQFIEKIGLDNIHRYETALIQYAHQKIKKVSDLQIIGTAEHKVSVLSFVLKNIHAHDIGTILDQEGIAVRVGHHCAQPLMQKYQIPATVRISFGLYNTFEEVDILIQALNKVKKIMSLPKSPKGDD
ncbi:cysteine desulfurase [bacterium]|jgi:cysteine desulfurase / selenocysteine lyase|nr:cysteine desulfurase [bacterium]MBT3581122.1 cysteine desulfurase [bacterium]MBT4552583.1 cysteine desulfurase [bacterium]MBT5988459.1 cysteine desulfurase [bacterium]MBT7088625.1 cysteine desulfurase [bacterium]